MWRQSCPWKITITVKKRPTFEKTFCPPPPSEDVRCQRAGCRHHASSCQCRRRRLLGERSEPGESQAADAGRGRAGENRWLTKTHHWATRFKFFHMILIRMLFKCFIIVVTLKDVAEKKPFVERQRRSQKKNCARSGKKVAKMSLCSLIEIF